MDDDTVKEEEEEEEQKGVEENVGLSELEQKSRMELRELKRKELELIN